MKLFVGAVILATVLVRPAVTSGEERNRCGCYRDSTGACFCEKRATCGCPGECEPRGCEEKRDKEIQKEIEAETKKAQESDRKDSASKDEESEAAPAPTKRTPPPARQGLTPVQGKQLAKLLDLYLGEHPQAGGMSIAEVREALRLVR